MIDGGLRKLFRDNLKTRGYDLLSVETRATSAGVPDMNYCKDGIEGWIEFKKAERNRVTIRPAQIGWAERRIDHGGRVFLAIRHGGDLWLYHGAYLRHLATRSIADVGGYIYQCGGGPARWDWDIIEGALSRWQPLVPERSHR